MKKIISIVLLLTLCLGLFAGCVQPEEPVSDLANAKAILFSKYKPASKDEIPAKSADFEVITSVLVDEVSYPVEWTVAVTKGAADAVKIVDGSSAAFKKIDLTEKPAEEIEFTLTAVISDAQGKSETLEFKFKTPAFEAPTADKVVIKIVADNKYATGTEYEYTSSSGNVKMELTLTENKAEALPLTMINNADGTVTFKTDCGKFLYCDANSVEYVAEESDYTKFVLEAADGGYYIKCAVANYNGNPQFLEVYSGYLTCYGMNESSNLALYIFALEDAGEAAGTVVEHTGSDEKPEEPEDPETPAEKPDTLAEQIAAANQLANKTYLPYESTITGTITDEPAVGKYDPTQFKFTVSDGTNTILCYYVTIATGTPKKGDTITVTGKLTAYNGSAQFDSSATGTLVAVPGTLAEQIAEANKLANKTYLPYESTITGTITDEPAVGKYDATQFKFTVSDGTNTILCYYVTIASGTPKKGDTITVTGKLTAYNGSAQFDSTAKGTLGTAGETPDDTEKPAEPSTPADATISFDNTANRTVMTTEQQVWVQNGITVTNNKAESTSDLKDYSAPVRFYANTSLKIEYKGMKTIKFNCNTDKYANALKDALTGTGYTVTVSGKVVTVTFTAAVDSFEIAKLVAQVRVDSIEIFK